MASKRPVGSSAASIRRGNRPNTAFGFRGCFDMRNTLQHNPGPRENRISPAGYLAAFFLRAAQEAFIRSDTASFSLAVIGRRFLVGVASDAVSATGVAAAAVRREEERRVCGLRRGGGAEDHSVDAASACAPVRKAPGQPPWASITWSISAMRRMVSFWATTIFW